jgi:FliI/YscN family ATPase
MSRRNSADVTVIALIGERNREVRAFIENELGPEGRQRSVVIAATSDRPAPLRIRACFVAVAIAEYFRDQGANVLLVMDSVTRLAMAQRELGLAAGEPPSQRGYTPSVFNLLPRIFERAGNFERGSITGFFTVLVEGDDFNEPVCDAVRGILDGHIILSRDLGASGHYPAIDVLQSVSRVMNHVVDQEHLKAAQKIREAMSCYQRSADLIQLGAYVAGSNPKLDIALRSRERLLTFLKQDSHEASPLDVTVDGLRSIARELV